jgi:mannose-6-phosphate isomerase-like protein (cupin superfamily)
MQFAILDINHLRRDGNALRFDGHDYGDAGVSFLAVDLSPGDGPRLHKHAYGEILIVQEGRGSYTVGATSLEATAGQILLVPPNTPHKFHNSGDGPLRQLDLHLTNDILTEWLED